MHYSPDFVEAQANQRRAAQARRDQLLQSQRHPAGTAGALMISHYSSLDSGLSASQAIDMLRREAADAETIYQSYVLDEQRNLLGTVSLRELILAAPEAAIEQVMVRNIISVSVQTLQEEVARLIRLHDLLAVPVLDDDGRLVGLVTCDEALDVVVEEATEDFHKGALIANHVGNLRDATLGLLYRKRVLWLVLLVFGNLFSGAGIAAFEETIAAHIALVFFLPLLVDSGGNAGAQSATLMVRGLATGEVVMADWLRMLGRECGVALALGATMAVAVASLGMLRGGADIAFIVASSMLVIVLIGSLIGMSLPFLLSRINLDPATASGPLVTSVADAVGVLIYFGIASQVLDI